MHWSLANLFVHLVQYNKEEYQQITECPKLHSQDYNRLQKFDHIIPVLTELKWLSVESMLIYRDCILVFKCLRGLAPDYPANKFKKRSEIHNKDTQNKNKIDIPGYRTATGQRTFHYQAVSLWNSLPERLTERTNLVSIQKGTYASFIKRILEALL